MVFKVHFSGTRKNLVKKNMSVSCEANNAEQTLKRRFAEENDIENIEDVEIMGTIEQSNKGNWYALVQGKTEDRIEDDATVEADTAKEAMRLIEQEYGLEKICIKSICLAEFEKKRRSA